MSWGDAVWRQAADYREQLRDAERSGDVEWLMQAEGAYMQFLEDNAEELTRHYRATLIGAGKDLADDAKLFDRLDGLFRREQVATEAWMAYRMGLDANPTPAQQATLDQLAEARTQATMDANRELVDRDLARTEAYSRAREALHRAEDRAMNERRDRGQERDHGRDL